jgi:lycopene beta-cyclase
LFTEKVLIDAEYEEALKEYIAENLSLSEYKILHKEKGIIPMTNQVFPLQDGNVVYIGTAGGQVKPSSGYAFQFIQKRTTAIVKKLVNNKVPFFTKTLTDKKFDLYDSTLLQVMVNNQMPGDAIFAAIFKKVTPQRILRFLDNETTLLDDISILNSVPTRIFLPAALKEIFL